MKRALIILAVLFLAAGVRAEEWRFAPLPMENPETVVAAWKPLLDYLAEKLGVTIRIDYSTSYAELLDKFAAGKLDLAYLGPLPYVELKKRLGAAEPLVHFKEKNGESFYTCALVTNADSGLRIERLVGKRIALTQPLSTCGYLATDGMLREKGSSLDKNRYRYLDKHDAVALAVSRGEYDAGGVKTAIARKYAHLGVVVLAESRPFPGFALVAHAGRIDPARRAQLVKLLSEVDPAIRQSWGEPIRHGAIAARDGDYDAVRRYLPAQPIPERGNF
ncbi:MAG: PhnD/SsuA/transferrin family substrate-binding protein [Rhodocyclaceae bacterium]|nr:PhnD/SsuA/transferrin family substrate-binding protein [Rhodocyclaceae bacterium]